MSGGIMRRAGILLLLLFLCSAGLGASSLVLAANDRCTLKLEYWGPFDWRASCSGNCDNGADCDKVTITNAQGNTHIYCMCGSWDPIVPCDGEFIYTPGQVWIKIHCWNDTCTTECVVNGGFGVVEIPACYCPNA
jgi:hypothetical protein